MLSIIVPVRNEPNINEFLLQLHEVMADVPENYEVIVVRGDRETLSNKIQGMPHQIITKTYGDSVERSLFNGFSQSRGDNILCLDSDGSHPLSMVIPMFNALRGHEMVVGSRFMGGGVNDSTFFRKLVTYGCMALAHEAGSKLTDPMSGFFAVKKTVIDRCRFRPLKWKTCLEIELRAKPDVVELPIKFVDRKIGESKTNWRVGLTLIYQLLTELSD